MGIISAIKLVGLRPVLSTFRAISRHGFTLLALLDAVKRADASIRDDHENLSYANLYNRSVALALHLHERFDIQEGSRIAIISKNGLPFVTSLFAASGLGADIYLINPGQTPGYFQEVLALHRIDLIIGDTDVYTSISRSDIPFLHIGDVARISVKPAQTKILKWKQGNVIIMSAGSKGKPKPEKRKISPLRFLDPLADIIQKLELKQSKSVFISVPLFHGYGLAALLISIFLRKKIRLTKKFNTEGTLKILESEKPDCWVIVPLMLTKAIAAGNEYLEVKSILSGGDSLPADIARKVSAKTMLYNLYGTSETGICTIATPADLRRYPDTIGKLIDGIQVHIDSATGVMSVKCAWSSDAGKGSFIPTGDVISINGEGYCFYKGRKDDMMVIAGENVYPIELENIIYKYPGVQWCKAKCTSTDGTQKIYVDIVVNPEHIYSEDEFLRWLSHNAPRYMVPAAVNVLIGIPESKLM